MFDIGIFTVCNSLIQTGTFHQPMNQPGPRVHHAWLLRRRRYEESGSAAPTGGQAQPHSHA